MESGVVSHVGGLPDLHLDDGKWGRWNGKQIIGRKAIDLTCRNQLTETAIHDFFNTYLAEYGYGLGVRMLMDPT